MSDPGVRIDFDAKNFVSELKTMQDGLKLTKKEYQYLNSELVKSGDELASDTIKLQGHNKQLEQQRQITAKLRSGIIDATKAREESREKVERLTDSLKDAEKSENANAKEIKAMQKELNAATKEFNNAENNITKFNSKLYDSQIAENKLEKSIIDTTKAIEKRKFDTLTKDLDSVNKGLDKIQKGFLTVAGLTAAGVGGLYKIATASADAADEVDKMSQKIGISRKAYQELSYSFGQSGADVNLMQTGMKKLVETMDQAQRGTEKALDTFKGLNVEFRDESGLRNTEEVLFEVIAALQATENETVRLKLATEMFGRSGSELMPLLNEGADAFSSLVDEANKYGMVLSDDVINAGVKFGDDLDRVKNTFKAISVELGSDLMPLFEKFIAYLQANSEEIGDTIENVVKGFAKFVKIIYDARGAIGALVGVFAVLKTALAITTAITAYKKAMEATTLATKGAQAAQVAFNATCMANPFAAVALVLGALTAGIVGYSLATGKAKEETRDFNAELSDNLKNIEDSTIAKQGEVEINKRLAKELDTLANKENKTNEEKQRMKSLAEQLNKAYSDLNLPISRIVTQYNDYKSAIDATITSAEKLIQLEAGRERAVTSQKLIFDIQEQYGSGDFGLYYGNTMRKLAEQIADKERVIKQDDENISYTGVSGLGTSFYQEYEALKRQKKQLENDYKAYQEAQGRINAYTDIATTEPPKSTHQGSTDYYVEKGVVYDYKTGKPAVFKNATNGTKTDLPKPEVDKKDSAKSEALIGEVIEKQEIIDLYAERMELSKRYIEDKKFYDNWGADNEIEAWQRVKEWTTQYYNDGTIDYKRYTKEMRDIDKNLYTSRKSALESYISDEFNAQRKILNQRKSDVEQYYSELERAENKQERDSDRAELMNLQSQYQYAVTDRGKAKLKEIQDNIKQLDKQEREEVRQLEKADKIKEIEKQYERLDETQLDVMKNISDYARTTADTLADITREISALVRDVTNGGIGSNRSITQNNYNTIADQTSADIFGRSSYQNLRFLN